MKPFETKETEKRTNRNLAVSQPVKEFGTGPFPPSILFHPPPIKVMYGQRMDVPLSEPVAKNADGWRDGEEKAKKEKECR